MSVNALRCLALALLAACAPEPEATPDAGPEAVALDVGEYALEWTCEAGCPFVAPFAVFDRLVVAEDLALTFSTTGTTATALDFGALDEAGCVVGAGIPIGDEATAAYRFCPGLDGPTATVVYTGRPGPVGARREYSVVAR